MLKDLFVNFTILATVLFFGNVFLNRFRKSSLNAHSAVFLPVLAGLALGGGGILLMEFSFPLTDYAIIDLRQTAIIIAIYTGGLPGGFIATFIIAGFRLFFFGQFGLSSFIGAANGILTFLLVALVLRKGQLDKSRWAAAFVIQFVVLMVGLYFAVGPSVRGIIPLCALVTVTVGTFIYLMLRHLQNSNESFAIMEDAAHRDFLTNLYNPRAFFIAYERRVRAVLKDSEASGFGLILIDIDHFKQVNDQYGHPAGDVVLRQVGTILSACSPTGGYCARNGGEEFVLIIDRQEEEVIARIAERIRLTIEGHPFLLEDETRLDLTVSLGYGLSDEGSPKTLFQRVDDALYLAKASGRNRVGRAAAEVGAAGRVVANLRQKA
ncbi:hypothetical protein B9G55_10210 [Saccharibacillus sp. O16]|nr:hypothetical protein B9G55_10210 [Saccharibacillus sp. O16]